VRAREDHPIDRDEVVRLAADLIAVEGHQDLALEERPMAEAVASWCHDQLSGRADVRTLPVGDDRLNVVATLRGGGPGPRLLLNAHLDTVPGYGMPNAYVATCRDGRLYGRGAVDMKGAMAAMLCALRALDRTGGAFAGELVFAGVAGEENGSPGMQALVDSDDIAADFAVVGEPTGLRVARAHKGSMWIEVTFHGRATHGSVPHEGVNAAYAAARFVTAVEEELAPRLAKRRHPLLGPATVNVGVVRGGDRPPMVPAVCHVQLDRRLVPGEEHEDVLAEVRELAFRAAGSRSERPPEVAEMGGTSGFPHTPLDCPADDPGVRILSDVVADRLALPADPIGMTFWTDAALLASATGTPTVVCGPGDIAQAHSLDEWVDVEQLHAAAEIYFELATRFLAVPRGAVQ
jgi:succinyl-diaminopimelate desuccinylase